MVAKTENYLEDYYRNHFNIFIRSLTDERIFFKILKLIRDQLYSIIEYTLFLHAIFLNIRTRPRFMLKK